jgi:N-acetylglucosaminyldiphosphoundecaprenol N-acetyl-beta-D-mannosaminyltransferase
MDEALQKLDDLVRSKKSHNVAFINAHCLNIAYKNSEYKQTLKACSEVFADGIGAKIGARMLGYRVEENVNGTDMFPLLADKPYRIYLFGGAPGVANAAARKMMKKYPGLKVVGVHNGYFDEKEEKRIIQDIKEKSPSILLVGLGAPKQEKWIYDNLRLIGAKAAIGVGGSFDVMAGNVKRAPKIFQKLGLEWFHRLITQPTRWRRMMRLPKFALTILKTKGR